MKPDLAQLILQPVSVLGSGIIYTATRNLTVGLYLLCGHGLHPERSKSILLISSLKLLLPSLRFYWENDGGILSTSA